MNEALKRLINGNQLEQLDDNLFLGMGTWPTFRRLYGGEVMSQAISAAQQTVVDDKLLHSFHSYFMRPGDPERPVIYDVENVRDGRSFLSRRVTARQHGHAIFACQCSFQGLEDGFYHQDQCPAEVPAPEELPSDEDLVAAHNLKIPFVNGWPIEYRQTSPHALVKDKKLTPHNVIWFRAEGDLPQDIRVHQQLVAFASDSHFLSTAIRPHGVQFMDPRVKGATIDHSMWFHRPPKVNEWMMYEVHSPWAGNSRGLNFGKIFDRQGQLVASTAQEGMMRFVEKG